LFVPLDPKPKKKSSLIHCFIVALLLTGVLLCIGLLVMGSKIDYNYSSESSFKGASLHTRLSKRSALPKPPPELPKLPPELPKDSLNPSLTDEFVKQQDSLKSKSSADDVPAVPVADNVNTVPSESSKSKPNLLRTKQPPALNPPKALDLLLAGEISLIGLKKVKGAIVGKFCEIDWEEKKKDPASFSFFMDLVKKNECNEKGGTHSIDLKRAVSACKAHDQLHGLLSEGGIVEPAGFVFHESRCGSTLAANVLEVVSDETRVFAESPIIPGALKFFKDYEESVDRSNDDNDVEEFLVNRNDSEEENPTTLLRDVHYLATRSPSGPVQVFYKFTTVAMWEPNLDPVLDAFPKTPWIYIMRNPTEVMMSYARETKGSQKVKESKGVDMGGRGFTNSSNCFRKSFNEREEIKNEIRQYMEWKEKGKDDVPNHVYCAAHLAVINAIALKLYYERPGGRFVDYSDLVETLKLDIIPNHFGFHLDDAALARITETGGTYSKASRKVNKIKNETMAKEWVGDAEKKIDSAPEFVVDTVQLMLEEGYGQMLKLA